MRSAAVGLALAVILLGLSASAFPASADSHISADLTSEVLQAEAAAEKNASPMPSNSDGDSTSSNETRLAKYILKRIVDYYLDQPCGSEPDHVNTAVRYVEIDPADDDAERMLLDTFECLPIPRSGDPDEFEVPPPRAVDIQDAVSELLPVPDLFVDPDPEGLTGLDAYLWYGDDGASELEAVDTTDGEQRQGLSVTASAGPYEITATAWIVEYRWETGDGATYTSSEPGAPERPAATHVYEAKGDYTVVTEAIWVGSYTWTVGSISGSGDLDAVTRRSEHPYTVVEARAVLTR